MERRLPAGAFFGSVDRRWEVEGLILSETLFPAHHDIPSHAHENAYFRFVLNGLSTDTTRRRTFRSDPGTLVFHPADDLHANYWSEGGGRSFNIELTRPWLARLRTPVTGLEPPDDFTGGMPVWIARWIYREFVARDSASPLAIEGLMFQLLAELVRGSEARSERSAPAWLLSVRELLEARFTEPVSIGELAAVAGVNPDYLSSAFRKQYGLTVGEYVRKRRIEFACRQIATSGMSLVEIALEAGFYDQSHFTRSFKQRMGITPAEYRASCTAYRLDTRE